MLQISREHESAEDSSGKSLHHVARYTEERPGPGPDRDVLDIVTDDWTIYRFSQLAPSDPWSFEPGANHTNRAGRHGRLPGVVESIIEAEASPFLTQWALFDCNRGSVEPHNLWFDHVNRIVNSEGISTPGAKG